MIDTQTGMIRYEIRIKYEGMQHHRMKYTYVKQSLEANGKWKVKKGAVLENRVEDTQEN